MNDESDIKPLEVSITRTFHYCIDRQRTHVNVKHTGRHGFGFKNEMEMGDDHFTYGYVNVFIC